MSTNGSRQHWRALAPDERSGANGRHRRRRRRQPESTGTGSTSMPPLVRITSRGYCRLPVPVPYSQGASASREGTPASERVHIGCGWVPGTGDVFFTMNGRELRESMSTWFISHHDSLIHVDLADSMKADASANSCSCSCGGRSVSMLTAAGNHVAPKHIYSLPDETQCVLPLFLVAPTCSAFE